MVSKKFTPVRGLGVMFASGEVRYAYPTLYLLRNIYYNIFTVYVPYTTRLMLYSFYDGQQFCCM
jgi:hypothetical protein